MRGAGVEATLLLAGLVVAAQAVCQPGHTWWDSEREFCIDCTRCDIQKPQLLVLRPCQLHQDTVCAPLKDLDIDWPWLVDYSINNKHKRRRQGHKKKHDDEQIQEQKQNEKKEHRKIVWRYASAQEQTHTVPNEKQSDQVEPEVQVTNREDLNVPEESGELSDYSDSSGEGYADYGSEYEVNLLSEPLADSSSDITWDTHTLLLTVAASVCVIVFILVAVYSIHHARQWRLIKKNLQADVEGLSAKINLMMASAENNEQGPPSPPPHYTNLRCAYLEQLLVGKKNERGPGAGNVYIQENNT